MKHIVLPLAASVAISALCAASAAAQAVAPESQASATSADAEATASQPAEPQGLADIVVTAQRRSESVQHSSLAIQVIGSDQLVRAGVSQTRDLVALVPGLQIAAGSNTAQTFIRGVGDFSSTSLGQSAVGYNVDGVYVADTASISPLFYDIQRIEVLKGPQGTLYGRNASGGAINILSTRPDPSRIGATATLEYGNYDNKRATAAINIPISSQAAFRAAGNYVDRDGYESDGTDDDKQKGGRLSFLYKGDRLSLFVTGDIEHRGGAGPGAVLLPHVPGNGKFVGPVDAANNAYILSHAILPGSLIYTPGAGLPPAAGVTTGLLRDAYVDNTQRNISGELSYDLGGVTATFVPAYRTSSNHIGSYIASVPFINNEWTHQQSYEFRLSHDSARIKAVAGVYYLKLDQFSNYISYISPIPGLTVNSDNNLGTKSIAGFAQVTLSVSDPFRIIAGGRYTHENRTIDGFRQPIVGGGAQINYTGDTDFNNFSFRTGVEYDLSPRNMLYATISRGFKSGGFNTYQGTATQPNFYQPEKLYSYTAGIRNRFMDNKLQLNVEGFYWDYQNSQQTHFGYDPTGALQFMTFNAATAHIYGADLDLAYKITSADTLTFTAEYLHAKFRSFTYDIPSVQYHDGMTGCPVSAGATTTTINCSGFPLPRSPRLSGTVGYQHKFALGADGSVIIGGDLNFATKRYLAVDYIANEYARGYVRENAFVTVDIPHSPFSVTGYVKNITNQEVPIGGIEAAFVPGLFIGTVDAPRTYGLRLQAKF